MSDIGEFVGWIRMNFDSKGLTDASAGMKDMQAQGSALDAVTNRLVFTFGDMVNAGQKVASFMWSFVSASAEAELANKKLADAMKVQQVYSDDAYNANLKYAESMQSVTKYDKENILATMQLLTTFGLHDEQLRKTTTSVMDLAARGYDLHSVSMILGKAFEGNTTALKRYGIVIDDSIPQNQKFDEVLSYIQKHMGGLALGEAQTLSGKLSIMNNNVKELKENIGNLLLPTLSYWADKLSSIAKFVNELKGAEEQEANVSAKTAKDKLTLLEQEKIEIQARLNQLKQYMVEGSFVNQAEVRQIEERLALITKAEDFIREKAIEEVKVRTQAVEQKEVLSLTEQQMAQEAAAKEVAENKKSLDAMETNISQFMNKRRTEHQQFEDEMLKVTEKTHQVSLNDVKKNVQDRLALVKQGTKEEEVLMLEVAQLDKQISEQRLAHAQQLISATTSLVSSFSAFQSQDIQNGLQESLDANQKDYDAKAAWITANVTDATEQANQLQVLAQNKADKDKQLQDQATDDEKKRKQEMKPALIAEAIANTAIGVTKAIAEGGLFGIATGVIVAAAGAVQIATIQAQKFAKGVKNFGGGLAWVGEEGPELLDLPQGTNVYNNTESKQMSNAMTIHIYANGPTNKAFARQISDEIVKQVNVNRKW